MKMFIECAVEQTIIPMTIRPAPKMAMYLLPNKSDKAPTNGQTAAKASKLDNTNQVHLSAPPKSP